MRERSYREIRWPFSGLHVGRAFTGQPHDTSVACRNVRNYDPATGRSRGAQRAGLTRYVDAQASGSGNVQIQCLDAIITVPTDAGTLTDLKTRTYTTISVCDGDVQSFTTSSFGAITNGTNALSATAPVIFSAVLYDTMYFADGISTKKLTGTTVSSWTATAGTFPTSSGRYPRLICNWRGRIVLSGLKGDAHNYFMSAVGDPGDWDYGATVTTTMAVAGSGAVGPSELPDIINTLIPYSDDVLIVGCDHTIFQFTGDPADGGHVDLVSDMTGMAFGRPWCKAYGGVLYFVGSRGGIYRWVPGQNLPERISADRIEENLKSVDLNTTLVRCVYDDRTQGVHFFFTELDQSASTHYYYDIRKDAFFQDVFADPLYNPCAVFTLDGDDVDDRVVLIGGFDRRIRQIDYDNHDDDQKAINSYVWLGPLKAEQGQKVHLNDLIGTLDDNCDGAYYEVYAAQGSQIAYERGQLFHSGQWGPGRNGSDHRRASGTAIYIKLGNSDSNSYFAYESIMAALKGAGITATRQQV